MNLLITGGHGMVGRNLREHRANDHHHVLAPSRQELDLMNLDAVRRYFSEHEVDAVIHLAGKVGGIQDNLNSPFDFYQQNIVIGQNLLQVSLENKVPKFLNISSACVYPASYRGSIPESAVLSGSLDQARESYCLAKLSIQKECEYISQQYASMYYKSLVPCNLYGKYDKFEGVRAHLIPAIILKVAQAVNDNVDTIEIWGDGLARREFMSASDLADFIWYALAHIEMLPQSINVGVGTDYSINDYYYTIAELLGFSGSFRHDVSKPVGAQSRLLDVGQLALLGWRPKLTMAEGLKETINYFKQVYQ